MPRKEVVSFVRKLDIPEDKIAEYKEAFDMFDKEGKGTISATDITKIMKNFGNPVSKKEVERMIAEIDTSGDGELDFEEFVTLMQRNISYIEESEEDLVLRAFKAFDKDKSGAISIEEIMLIFKKTSNDVDKKVFEKMMKEVDLNGDGVIQFDEFQEIMEEFFK